MPNIMKRRRDGLAQAGLIGLGVAIGAHLAGARKPPALAPLLATETTIVGEPIAYPKATPAKITAAVVALPPGGETGWHTHGVPVFGYILDGEVTVDYGAKGTRIYRAGDSLMEAMAVSHNGRNTGTSPVRILAVFMGAEGAGNTEAAPAPDR